MNDSVAILDCFIPSAFILDSVYNNSGVVRIVLEYILGILGFLLRARGAADSVSSLERLVDDIGADVSVGTSDQDEGAFWQRCVLDLLDGDVRFLGLVLLRVLFVRCECAAVDLPSTIRQV